MMIMRDEARAIREFVVAYVADHPGCTKAMVRAAVSRKFPVPGAYLLTKAAIWKRSAAMTAGLRSRRIVDFGKPRKAELYHIEVFLRAF